MKILNRTQFLALRGEHLYATLNGGLDELSIKMCNIGSNDFCDMPLTGNTEGSCSSSCMHKLWEAKNNPGVMSIEVTFDDGGRDGMFDPDQMFAVYEDHEVQALINRLQEVLNKTNNYEEN